jgi:transposase
VVQELLKEEETLAQIGTEYEVHQPQLKKWRAVALEGLPGLFEKRDSTAELKAAHEQQLTELYAEIGKLTTQVAWLKKNLELSLARMDGKGRALDNIFTERLWRTIKYEEVYVQDSLSPREARQQLTSYLEFYNHQRLHQALSHRTPAEVYFQGGPTGSAASNIRPGTNALVKEEHFERHTPSSTSGF